MRIGIVPYLNCFPLVYGLKAEIYSEAPSRLVSKAREEDILLAPVIEAFANPGWYLIDDVGIGSLGAVETVKLFLKKPGTTIKNLKSIFVDRESLTSTALLKIILQNFFHRPAGSVSFPQTPENAEGLLLIGDKTWNSENPRSTLDLGELWTEFTGLPFLFACWMTRSKETGLKWKGTLAEQSQKNLGNLPALISQAPQNNCPDLLAYWRRLRYTIDDESKKGVTLFQKLWAELEKNSVIELQWI